MSAPAVGDEGREDTKESSEMSREERKKITYLRKSQFGAVTSQASRVSLSLLPSTQALAAPSEIFQS